MKTLLEKLNAIGGILSALLLIASRKKDIIVRGKPEELEKLLREETALLARMKPLEDERQRAAMLLAIEKKLPPINITITKLLEKCDEDEAGKLSRAREELRDMAEELSRMNEINNQLLQAQADIAKYTLETSMRPTQLGVQYSPTGADTDTVDPVNLFDRQA